MIPCSAEEYYHKVDNMVLSSCQNVRKLLRDRWKTETGKDWVDGEEQGKEFIQRYGQIHKQAQKIQKGMIASGCLEEWDMSTLSSVIQNFGDAKEYKRENEAVRALTRMRNDLAHHPTKKLSLDEYTKKVDTLRGSLLVLGVSKNDITKVIEKAGITSSVQALESVKKLYEAAMIHEKVGGDIEKAIECYTEAISTPSLLPVNQGVAYENRANCYLSQLRHLKSVASDGSSNLSDDEERRGNLLQQALLDSNQALELNDNSWKAHYLVAQCLRFNNKLTDAINHYHKALAISPVQKEVKQDLDACKVLATSQERGDPLNPRLMPMNLTERVDHLRNETGLNLTGDQFLKTSEMAGVMIKGQDHVSRGHQYFGGWNVPQDFSEAARHYAKAAHVGNAEGIYNLGHCYKTGRGVEQDIAKAFMYFKQAAEMPSEILGGRVKGVKDVGVAAAQCSLGLMYDGGIYVEQDYAMAAKWYQKSAENGTGNAANNLAILYANGLGVTKDEKMAEKYWNQAVILKDVNAAASLMQYYIRHLEPEKALNMFKTGKELGHTGLIHLTEEDLSGLIKPSKLQRNKLESSVAEFEKQHKLGTKGLTFLERLNRQISSQSVAGDKTVKMLKTLKSRESWGGRIAKNKIFEPEVLACLTEKAANGSITARRLLETVEYGVEIVERLSTNECTTEEEQMEIVRLFYKCATLELHAAPIPTIYTDKLKRIFGGLFDSKCETKGEDDMQIRFCFLSLNLAGRMESQDTFDVELVKQGIRRYPNNPNYYQRLADLYANKKDYPSSLKYSEEGLAKFPENNQLLYVKAFCLHSNQDCTAAIEAYKEFLSKAPPDDRKVPEAYYTLAYQYITSFKTDDPNGIKKLERYYKRGLEAEKNQLPIYLPYCSSARKNMIECLLEARNPSNSKDSSSTKQTADAEPKGILARKPYLTNNPVRTGMIHRHRENLSNYAKEKKRGPMTTSTVTPKLAQKCAKKMSNMKSITLQEMNPTSDHIYEDRVLDLTIIDDALLGHPSVHLIAEDDNGDVTRLYLYNVEQNRQTHEKFGFGCRIAILNPYMRIGAQDISHGIRNDEPKCIIQLEKVLDMCRFCGEEKAPHKCSKCKRTYCSRECQKLDWKVFNHNLICPLKL